MSIEELFEVRPRRRLEVLTNSRIKARRRCARYHFLRYDCGYRARLVDEDLELGTLVHLGLEAWWRARLPDGDGDSRIRMYGAIPEGVDPFLRAKAIAMLEVYDERWCGEDLRPLAVELEFYCPLVNPRTGEKSKRWILGGKIDVVAQQGDEVVLLDHKTSSEDLSPGSTFWRRMRMDIQPSIYIAGARHAGYDAAARFVYDVLGKSDLRPLKATPLADRKYTKEKVDKSTGAILEPSRLYASQRETDETPDEYGARVLEAMRAEPAAFMVRDEVARLERELDEVQRDLWDEAKALREAQITGRAPRNSDACVMYGRTCQFFDVCAGGGDVTDHARFTRCDEPHSELEHVPAEEQPTTGGVP